MSDAQPNTPAPETTPAPAAAPVGEEAELLALAARDQPTFEYYRGPDGTEKTGAERLLALQNARKAEAEKAAPPHPGEQTEGDDAADANDVVAETEGDGAEPAEGADQEHTPWPERPEHLKEATDEEIAAWKAEQGLPDREEYQLPELDDGKEYTDYGRALSAKVVELAYDLDMSPEQAQQFVLRGDPLLKALAESRDAEDKRTGSKALLDQFDGDRDAAKAHVAEARAALKSLPDELGKLLLDARGPDGRKLGFNPEFLRWAAQLGARSVATGQPQQDARTTMQQELAEIDAAMHQDVANLYKPWRGTGKLATDRKLEILRQLGNEGQAKPSASDLRTEMRDLEQLKSRDPQMFQFGSWPGARSPADRLHQLQAGRG